MRLRYPEGVRSQIDADLTVRGNFKAPTLGGHGDREERRLDERDRRPGRALRFRRPGRRRAGTSSGGGAAPSRFRPRVPVPSTLRIENNLARMVASADLELRGTYDRPVLLGRADIERGEVTFEGRRYQVTRGTIDFTNPTRDRAVLRRRGRNQRARARPDLSRDRGRGGTTDRLQPELSSDPPLPTADVLALLFSDTGAPRSRRRRAARAAESERAANRHPDRARDAGARQARVLGSRQAWSSRHSASTPSSSRRR